MNTKIKSALPYLGFAFILIMLACVFFSPVFDGKKLPAGDLVSVRAMVKENQDFAKATGEYTTWNSSLFSGMPNYQVGGYAPSQNYWARAYNWLRMSDNSDVCVLIVYFLLFFVSLACMGIKPWVAFFGAIAFGLGSYNLIIIEAGHITKANCIALSMPVLAGILISLHGARSKTTTGKIDMKKLIGGGILFAIAINLQLACNHIQITYYTAIGGALIALTYLVYAIKDKWLAPYVIAGAILLAGAGIAVGCNARNLFISQEYAKYTMRGGSEITVTPENLYNDSEPKSDYTSSGLSIDYAYSWSYGVGETYTLLVPGAMGGGSGERVSKESASYKNFRQTRAPLYWGDQPFTSGPVYFGAIVIFLFIFGLFVVRGPERWWLLAATIVGIVLSWGRHFMAVNEWLFYHLPMYSMFRTPSMALVLSNVAIVLMAVLALKAVIDNQRLPKAERRNMALPLYISGGITAGILLIGLMLSGGFSYSGVADEQMAAQYKDQWSFIQNIFIQDRKALFVSDSWRSLLFVALAFAVLWLYVSDKIKKVWLTVVPLTVLVLVDLWGVDRRYIAKEDFVKPKSMELHPEAYDAEIDRQAAHFGDVDYRVLNLAVNTFNDAKPSAYHHQIGGYSAVKLRRYQDIIDFYISRHINWRVLDMLNMRYLVTPDRRVQRNPNALGNCWFVDDYRFVSDPNGEILALNEIDPAKTAVVDSSQWASQLAAFVPTEAGATDTIVEDYQTPYHPGYLRYKSHSEKERIAVFSEVFYRPDWFVYIDGKRADYFRANYILRAMVVPAGDHVIEFRNEAPRMHSLDRVSLICSILLLVIAVGGAFFLYVRERARRNKTQQS
ncbi:MAG: hypothetical protein IJ620_05090 [Bacteroidales bacterium]|nr:hypothetical protein [Bacteroidales bacterium]